MEIYFNLTYKDMENLKELTDAELLILQDSFKTRKSSSVGELQLKDNYEEEAMSSGNGNEPDSNIRANDSPPIQLSEQVPTKRISANIEESKEQEIKVDGVQAD